MLAEISPLFGAVKQRFITLFRGGPCRVVAVSGLLLLLLYVFSFDYRYSHDSPETCPRIAFNWWSLWPPASSGTGTGTGTGSRTNLSHIVFGIVGSLNTWGSRKPYLESWWRPNLTRGYLFLDGTPNISLLCPFTCPALRINEDITSWEIYPAIKRPTQIRMVRSILETFRQGDQDVRWFMMADDDSVLFVDNIVQVLSKYDHTKYFYLGGSSESVLSNAYLTFEMGFGGAGFAMSYPLVAALAQTLDGCIKRYPYIWSADYLTYICILDLGVAVSPTKGFHQIDLHGDINGFLSSHPQSPLLSLHHVNVVDPIFPHMNRYDSIHHLMKPAGFDQSRLLQQTICYHKEKKWSISVSWGYSAHIYENMLPRYILRKPIETFRAWIERKQWPKFMFNTRPMKADPCEAPHWFSFESIERKNEDYIMTTYSRVVNRGVAPCSVSGNHSADHINRIRVLSHAKARLEAVRAECCDVLSTADRNTTTVRIRPCLEAEEIV